MKLKKHETHKNVCFSQYNVFFFISFIVFNNAKRFLVYVLKVAATYHLTSKVQFILLTIRFE